MGVAVDRCARKGEMFAAAAHCGDKIQASTTEVVGCDGRSACGFREAGWLVCAGNSRASSADATACCGVVSCLQVLTNLVGLGQWEVCGLMDVDIQRPMEQHHGDSDLRC